jgi:hypothetical protein
MLFKVSIFQTESIFDNLYNAALSFKGSQLCGEEAKWGRNNKNAWKLRLGAGVTGRVKI